MFCFISHGQKVLFPKDYILTIHFQNYILQIRIAGGKKLKKYLTFPQVNNDYL
jgi:hypothetical protein